MLGSWLHLLTKPSNLSPNSCLVLSKFTQGSQSTPITLELSLALNSLLVSLPSPNVKSITNEEGLLARCDKT